LFNNNSNNNNKNIFITGIYIITHKTNAQSVEFIIQADLKT